MIGAAVIVALIIKVVAIQAFFIPSGSMEPLLTDGDRVVVNKLAYKFGDLDRGDVVVFKAPPGELDPAITDLVKRVVALEGDTVEGKDGVLYVNNKPQDEPYTDAKPTEDFDKTTIPKGMFWAMGDNRTNSSDSRDFGAVSENLIVGKVDVLVWPLDRIRTI